MSKNKNKNNFRIEEDGFGAVKIPENAYWGSSTQRALELFKISDERFPPALIKAFAQQKKAAALANIELGFISGEHAKALLQAIDELMAGKFVDQFPLPIWQTGSGTQTNMNCNEVIANRANEILRHPRGKSPIHPNDHVNLGQSSNDTFPTVMRIVASEEIMNNLLPALHNMQGVLQEKIAQFAGVIKIGRTHLMDAVPVPFSQDFSAYEQQISHNIQRIKDSLVRIRRLPQGGTAAGTGLNAHPEFAEKFIKYICEITKQPFTSLKVKNEGMAAHDALVELSGHLNVLAVSLMKIANDVRWGASGPRCGLDEFILPMDGLTSSSMPGKVNPTQSEAVLQVCGQVMGNHVTITIAGSNGNFELNNWNPVITYNLLQSIRLLSDVISSFVNNCLIQLQLNLETLDTKLKNALSLVTALDLVIGYDKAAEIAVKALKENTSLKEAALKLGYLTAEEFDRSIDPVKMAYPFNNNK